MRLPAPFLAACLAWAANPGSAQELFGGVHAHAVETPLSLDTGEGGADVQIGYRFARLRLLANGDGPAPYAFASLNSAGDTNFIAAGLAWKVAIGPVYLRPGIGLSLNDGPERRVDRETGTRTELGSRVLFEPELALGTQLSDSVSLEASWVHISGAHLFNAAQNPGIDMIGVRVNWRFNSAK